MWTRLELRNLGRGGALLGLSSSLRAEGTIQGILTLGDWRQPVHAVVRHVLPSAAGPAVGVEFFDAIPDTRVRIAGELSGEVSHEEPAPGERRRYRRVVPPKKFAFESRDWINVELRDVSMGGAMFQTTAPLPVGVHGQFYTRFGDKRFDAAIEVRRVGPTEAGRRRDVGVWFVSMDRESRTNLATFLAAPAN
jgi:PilZ domain-containing protein